MLKNKKMWIALFTLVLMAAGAASVFAQAPRLGNPPRSLRGMDIIIGNYWEDYDAMSDPPSPGWVATESAELIREHRRRIQEQHGFRIRERMVASWNEMPQVAATSIMAGRPAAHVFALEPGWAMALYRQNLLFPVNTARSVNFARDTAVDWNRTVQNVFTLPDPANPRGTRTNQYAFQIGYGGSLHGAVVFFNKRLFQEAGLDPQLPYNLQRDGRWTWDAFLDISRQLTRDVDGDGIIDTWAMTADLSTEILDVLLAGNNAMYVDQDPRTRRLVNATGRPEFLEALQFAIRLQREGVMMPRPEGTNWDWYKAVFNDGRVAMRLEQEWVRGELMHMRDDWGMVLPPLGPRLQARGNAGHRVFTSENVLVIPNTFTRDQVDAILWAVRAWNAPVEEDWRLGLFPIFRDPRAVNETMAMIRDPARQQWKFHLHVPGLNRGNIAWEMWWFDGEPAQLIESVANAWDLRIMDANGD